MIHVQTRWGTLFFILTLPLVGGLLYFFYTVPPGIYPQLYQKQIPATGLIISFLVLFFGHFSYSRIHSAKVYFLGYSAGLSGLAYFGLHHPAYDLTPFSVSPNGYSELITLITLINLSIISFFPLNAKYRIVRSITVAVVVIESVLFLILRFGTGSDGWLKYLTYSSTSDLVFWLGPLFFFIVFLISARFIKNEFFLGGIVAGGGLLCSAAWVCRLFLSPVHTAMFNLLIFIAFPLFSAVAIVVHGFFRMEHRIVYDPLLQIYNRDYCSRIITEQASMNTAPPFGVAMVDIDHFKQVNDTYGHQAGDLVLHAVAQAVKEEAGSDGIACRYGGEELVVFFPQMDANAVAERSESMRSAIEKMKTRSGKKNINVTISVGVSHRDATTQSIVDVIQAADKALYSAKNNGRNQVKTQKSSSGSLKK